MKLGYWLMMAIAPIGLAACNGQPDDTAQQPTPPDTAATAPGDAPAEGEPAEPSPSPSPEWYEYASEEGNYKVMFPGEPEIQTDTLDLPTGEANVVLARYQDDILGRVYLFSHNQIPLPEDESVQIEEAFDSSRDSIAAQLGAEVKDEKDIETNGYPGREIVMRREGRFAAKVRVFYANQTQYMAIVGTEDENLDVPEVQKFLDSIAFVEQ